MRLDKFNFKLICELFAIATLSISNAFALDFNSIFGEQTYKVFSCKDISHNTSKECARESKAVVSFKVLTDKSEVFLLITSSADNKKYMQQLEDCKVIDKLNWKCGGKVTSSDNHGVSFYMKEYEYHMVNGDVEMTDMYSRTTVRGYPPDISYSKGNKFVKN